MSKRVTEYPYTALTLDGSRVVQKVIEITGYCPRARKDEKILLSFVLLNFVEDNSDYTVAVIRRNAEGFYSSPSSMFNVSELENNLNERDAELFGKLAGELGLTRLELRLLMEKHAPKVPELSKELTFDIEYIHARTSSLLSLLKDRQPQSGVWQRDVLEHLETLYGLIAVALGKN